MADFLRRRWKLLALAAVILPVLAFVGLGLWIGHQVDRAIAEAAGDGAEDPVAALARVATGESHPLARRNRAIWALGQLGDPAALPALESLAAGRDCDHAKDVCQREIRKALAGCRGGLNLSAVVWRPAGAGPTGKGP